MRLLLAAACFLALLRPVLADPTPSLDSITVLDQGSQLTLIWHYYSRLMAVRLIPPDYKPAQVGENLTLMRSTPETLARTAFTLTVDGQARDPLSAEINLTADGGCYATLIYPGRKNAHVTLREDLLRLYPPGYVINYEIYSPMARARGVSGYFTGGADPPVAEYTQIGDDYRPSIFDTFNTTPVKLFKAELRAAWTNSSWLLLILVVVLLRPARELYPLAWIMALAWILPLFLWAAKGAQVPFPIHAFLPALVTAAIAALVIHTAPDIRVIGVALTGASLLNGCYEIQRTTLERPPPTGANLTGLVLGLIAGFALIFALALPLLHECRKHPGFQRDWAPKIAGLLALAAIVLAFLG